MKGGTSARLRSVKLVHTLAWAFFASCTIGISAAALTGGTTLALVLIGVVAVEVVILAVNQWRCPLTAVAARYTEDRRPNFDIYLPEWLARYNKEIFGALLVLGILLTAASGLGLLA